MGMMWDSSIVNIFDNKKIILWGGGKINLEKFRTVNVIGVIEGERQNLPGIQVYNSDVILNMPEDTKVILVDDLWTNEIQYEFNTMLSKLGLSIGDDYIYSSMLYSKIDTNRLYCLINKDLQCFEHVIKRIIGNRKLVVIYGNCQTHALIEMIAHNKEFEKEYMICEMPRLWADEDKEKFTLMAESGILSLADYFFTQEVRAENRFGYMASTEYMFSLLSEKCKCFKISNLYFMGYFPQLVQRYANDTETMRIDFLGEKVFNTGRFIDHEVIELIIKGYSCDEIVRRISAGDYFDLEDLNRSIESELEKFTKREETLDIKMCDYLKDNYSKYCLFATANHPTKEMLLELSRRILTKLGISDLNILCEDDEIQAPMAKNLYFVIYPSVLKALGLPERRYTLHVKFRGCELAVLKGIDDELDHFINEKIIYQQELFEIKILLTFEKYMTVYVRMLQSVLHI